MRKQSDFRLRSIRNFSQHSISSVWNPRGRLVTEQKVTSSNLSTRTQSPGPTMCCSVSVIHRVETKSRCHGQPSRLRKERAPLKRGEDSSRALAHSSVDSGRLCQVPLSQYSHLRWFSSWSWEEFSSSSRTKRSGRGHP